MFCAERFVTIRHLPMVFNRLSVSSRSELILNNAIVSEEFNEIWKEKRKAKSCKLFASHQNLRCIKEKKKSIFIEFSFMKMLTWKEECFLMCRVGLGKTWKHTLKQMWILVGWPRKYKIIQLIFFCFDQKIFLKKLLRGQNFFVEYFKRKFSIR